jgi:hypothetical protein
MVMWGLIVYAVFFSQLFSSPRIQQMIGVLFLLIFFLKIIPSKEQFAQKKLDRSYFLRWLLTTFLIFHFGAIYMYQVFWQEFSYQYFYSPEQLAKSVLLLIPIWFITIVVMYVAVQKDFFPSTPKGEF